MVSFPLWTKNLRYADFSENLRRPRKNQVKLSEISNDQKENADESQFQQRA